MTAIPLNTLLALPLTNGGPAYTCQELARAMDGGGFSSRIYAPIDRRPPEQLPPARIGLSRHFSRVPLRLSGPVALRRIERRFLADCANAPRPTVAFLWGETSLRLAHALADQPTVVVREKYNCGKAQSALILRDAYRRLGAMSAFDHVTYSPRRLAKEQQELDLADYVFCPSPQVTDTLRRIGLPQAKLIPTSYGYDPRRLAGSSHALPEVDGPTFLFVGSICVRKGAHIVLEGWRRAALPKGRLVLLGRMEPFIAERFADVLARPEVEHHAFNPDIGGFYRSADYFIFPSLEEGGPQVTYEAAALGVPSLVTPMGAGAIVRDDQEGVVLDSQDVDAWAALMRRVEPGSADHRRHAAAATRRALDFTWERVGAQRRAALLDRISGGGAAQGRAA